ncbi:MAG TPA: helix-turn-helix domain-containing protein [Gemmatimonadales bacterium]|nr:helix-turn-helix domain-containing protein [Gemmatimonadales bacterium]
MPVVHGDPAARRWLRWGLPRAVRLRACRTVDGARTLLHQVVPDAVVVDVADGALEPALALAAAYPRVPVFAYSAFRPGDGGLLDRCRRGLAGVLVAGVDDPAAGELVARRSAGRVRERELAEAPRLLRLTEPIQRRAWLEVLARVDAHPTTTDIARALRRSREHLSREFAAGGAPNLKRVIDLARVACAADLLGNPGYQAGTVAAILGFSSGGHFAAAARRIAGAAPAELGRLGPRGVLQRFFRGRTRSRL